MKTSLPIALVLLNFYEQKTSEETKVILGNNDV